MAGLMYASYKYLAYFTGVKLFPFMINKLCEQDQQLSHL